MRPPPRAGTLAAMNPHSQCRTRVAAAIAVIAAALLAAGCGSSPSSTGSGGSANAGGSANSPSAVAWVQCVRSHGIPDFPGPDSNGQIPKITSGQQVGVSDSRFNAAQAACQRLWPYQAPTEAQQRQQLTEDLKFAHCMRSHGVPVPDPTTGPDGPRFVISISKDGFDPRSPQILAKARVCQHEMPAGWRLPSVTVTR
jgi:hypothetical protein